MQIFVLGMHRSGTSLIARLINLMGAYFGGEGAGLPTNEENPKGFWERRDVVDLNERLILERGATWYDVLPFVEHWRNPAAGPVASDVSAAIGTLIAELDAHRPWFIKDPRLCLTLGNWRAHCEVPVAVVCARNIGAIATSLSRRSGLTDMSYEEAAALCRAYLAIMLRQLGDMPRVIVEYERFVEKPEEETRRLHAALCDLGVGGALRMPTAIEIESFVEPSLQRSRGTRELEPLSAQFVAALGESAQIDEWLSGNTLDILRQFSQRRTRVAQEQQDRREAVAGLSERLSNEGMRALLTGDEARHDAGTPWTWERLRKLLD